jgi:hypothetical protein
MKRFRDSISSYEKGLEDLKAKKTKLIEDHEHSLRVLESEIVETEEVLVETKKRQDNSDIRHIRNTPTLWNQYYEEYSARDYLENNLYLGFTEADREDVNRYFHLTRPELERTVDLCIAEGAQHHPNKRRDVSFEFTFKENPYQYSEMYKKIRTLKVDQLCTVAGMSKGVGFFIIYLQRSGPPMGRTYIQKFVRMVKSYQPPQ